MWVGSPRIFVYHSSARLSDSRADNGRMARCRIDRYNISRRHVVSVAKVVPAHLARGFSEAYPALKQITALSGDRGDGATKHDRVSD